MKKRGVRPSLHGQLEADEPETKYLLSLIIQASLKTFKKVVLTGILLDKSHIKEK